MTALKSLTLTTLPQVTANPTLDRRTRIIARLEEQKLLLADPNYARTLRTTVTQDGVKNVVEKQQRVSKWWRLVPNGTYAFFIRVGAKPLEFEKGKTAVAVPSPEKLPAVIDALIAAIRAGELDQQLAAASKPVGGKRRKAT